MLAEHELKQYQDELIQLRRHFHKFPELANEENLTAEFIAKYLQDCGLKVKTGLANTGLIGILEGTGDPSIAIRTEMDALPINEENDVSYRSTKDNVMHACGHDGHMAVALVTAKILAGMKDCLQGNVIFFFQPAEENLPEGGAKKMVEEVEEVFRNIKAVFGFHFWPSYSTGNVAVSQEAMMAAGDIFDVVFRGEGSHGANPHQSSDVLLMTSEAVLSLTSIILRSIKPGVATTLSVGVIKGGESPNVLPAQSMIKGTTRYLDDSFKDKFPKEIKRILEGVCRAYNGNFDLDYQYGYPLLQNSPEIVEVVMECARAAKTVPQVITTPAPALASEDFAVFLKKVPGCYYWIGSKNDERGVVNSLHNPRFNFDESAMVTGVEMYLSICKRFLCG